MKPDFSQISHATIFVQKYESTLRFYTEILGLKILQENHGFATLDTSPIRLNIHESKVVNIKDTISISFFVINLEQSYQYLKKKNVRITREPIKYPDGTSMFNFVDPEGNSLAAVEKNFY
jgi:predicted enzyme related to lactoylglutathione lyase